MNNKFWNWFVENKQTFEQILLNVKNLSQEEIDEKMDCFEKNLHEYDERLWFRMGGNSPFELIITAEGNIDAFRAVQELVEHAPKIEGWKIIAFIQARDISTFYYKKDDYELTADDVFFSFAENISGENGYYLETMFYVSDDKYIDDEGFKSSIIRIAETALGEYDFAVIVGFINVVKVSEKYEAHASGLLPINKLSEIAEKIKQKIR